MSEMIQAIEPKRKRGRPSKGKRCNFTFRVTDQLRTALKERAASSKRSMSEEIEMILEKVLFPIKLNNPNARRADMSEALINRVALAIMAVKDGPFDSLEAARLAIKALREPTQEMVDACDVNIPCEGTIIGVWHNMIDAALK